MMRTRMKMKKKMRRIWLRKKRESLMTSLMSREYWLEKIC